MNEPPAPPPRFGGSPPRDLPPLPAPPNASSPNGSAGPQGPHTPPPPPAGRAAPTSGPGSAAQAAGLWLQLGAFKDAKGAQALQQRTAQKLPAQASRLRMLSDGQTHRLQLGPFASREAALDAAQQLRQALDISPMLVDRR